MVGNCHKIRNTHTWKVPFQSHKWDAIRSYGASSLELNLSYCGSAFLRTKSFYRKNFFRTNQLTTSVRWTGSNSNSKPIQWLIHQIILPLVNATPPGSHEASRGVEDVLSAVTKILPSRFQILAVIFNLVNVYLENRMRFEWRSKLWGWLRDGWCWFCVNWVRSKQLIFPLLFFPEVAFNLVLIMEQNAKYPRE